MTDAIWCSQCELEADVAQQHDFIVIGDLLETAFEQLGGLFGVAGEPFLIGAGHSLRRIEEFLRACHFCVATRESGNKAAERFTPPLFVTALREKFPIRVTLRSRRLCGMAARGLSDGGRTC